ncbi:MAG: SUMF1/EgtB/PvdO family nonheme iron enzyme [Pseudomonadota bacterium]
MLRALQNARDTDADTVAARLGFAVRNTESAQARLEPDDDPAHNGIAQRAVLYRAHHPLAIWAITAERDFTPVQPLAFEDTGPVDYREAMTPWMPQAPAWHRGALRNALDALLGTVRQTRQPHLKRAALHLARGEPVSALPRARRQHSAAACAVLVDFSPALRAVWPDVEAVVRQLVVEHDPAGLRVCVRYQRPGAGGWQAVSAPHTAFDARTVPPNVPVLVISDFGTRGGSPSAAWHSDLAGLARQGLDLRLLSLFPLRAAAWRSCALCAVAPDGTESLLSAMAACLWLGRAQLRALRLALGLSLADELAASRHPDVERKASAVRLRRDARGVWRARYQRWPAAQRARVERAVSAWAVYQPAAWRDAEQLQTRLAAGDSSGAALGNLLQLARVSAQSHGGVAADSVLAELMDLGCELADTAPVTTEHRQFLTALQAVAERNRLPQPLLGASAPSSRVIGLVQRGDALHAVAAFRGSAVQTVLRTGDAAVESVSRQPVSVAAPLSRPCSIIEGDRTWQLDRLTRPAWASRFFSNEDGIVFAVHADGARFAWQPVHGENGAWGWQPVDSGWTWADSHGVDERGLWADLAVANMRYRLRWIPPGRFQMGSPDDEAGRYENETLHDVTLSCGYWLGETTVTQAFWDGVLGKTSTDNANLPATDLSWEDCQIWCKKLMKKCPRFTARLPTEAEWENACRAGTQSAFWWGDLFDPSLGSEGDGVQDERDFPANPYGLRSMHGNVWEWCSDWFAQYGAGALVDPVGPEQGQERVLRGGSWFSAPRDLRAAGRNARDPAARNDFIGFRLAGGEDPEASRRAAQATADRGAGTAPRSSREPAWRAGR